MWLQVSHDRFSFSLHSVVLFHGEHVKCDTATWATTASSHLGPSPWALVFDLSVCTSFFFFLHLVFAQWCVATGAKVGEELCRSCMFHSKFFVPKPQTSHALLLVISHAQSLVTSPQATIIIGLHFSPHPLSFYSKAQVWRCMQVSRGREQGSSWSAVFKTSKSIHQSWNVIPE